MKKLLLSTWTALFVFGVNAQVKTNYELAKKMALHETGIADVFIEGSVSEIRNLLEQHGGTYKYASGNIAVGNIPVDQLATLLNSKAVKRIEAIPTHMQVMNDTMLINNNVVPVHNGQTPLPQAFDGTGVIMGYIDTGIDFRHPDFKDASGNSRVKFLWDQNMPTDINTPMPYNYGQEWNNTEIDAGMANAHDDANYWGHGTHVIGVGSGNGLATGNYKGVAPACDLVVVAFDESGTHTTFMADAVDYIYSKAIALGKPCVINASLGDYYGSHDGKDLQAQIIRNMIDAQPGRAFVAATGNGGDTPFHLGYTVSGDTSFSFFEPSGTFIDIQLFGDTADFKNLRFAIGADQFTPTHNFRGNTAFSGINDHLGALGLDALYNGPNRIGSMDIYGDSVNGVYSLEFRIFPDSLDYKWRLIVTGNGKFDSWSFNLYNGLLPSAATMPDSLHLKLPDTDKTITSSFNCLDNVISVGNYTNRKTYIDYTGAVYVNTASDPGVLHSTSSHGPTRDMRIKPDICAPGDMTVAAVVVSMAPDIIAFYPDAMAQGGYHIRDGGSSHAAPGVAGIAALYLQRFPSATATQVKNDIICRARQDSFTGSSLPNNLWGYGKADAFNALQGCLTTGVANQASNEWTLYPNPAGSGQELTIDPGTIGKLQVINQLGQLMEEIQLKGSLETLQLNLSPGVYYFKLSEKGKTTKTKKMVIL